MLLPLLYSEGICGILQKMLYVVTVCMHSEYECMHVVSMLQVTLVMIRNITHTDVDCGDLTDPDNGAVSVSGTAYNSLATYSCNSGYVLMGDDMRTCLDTGLWSGSTPVNLTACSASP